MTLTSTTRPALRGRVIPRIPATLQGSGGIAIEKLNGTWTVHPEFSDLVALTAQEVSDPTTKQVWIYDPVTDTYNVLTLAGLGDALYTATSTTSLAIGTGTKVFVTQSGKNFGIGSFVIAISDSDPTDFMLGQVTAYANTSLTVNVTTVGGSGTNADWTIRGSASAGSAGRSAGFLYGWDEATGGNPAAGKVAVNSASLATATAFYISETDSDSNALAAEIATWDDSTSTIHGRLKIYNQAAPANFAIYDVTGSNTDNGTWVTVNVTHVASGGTFTDADSFRVEYIPKGDKGDTGAGGSAGAAGTNGTDSGIKWLFDSTTAMADPGTGDLRLNNATLASVTAAAVSATSAESGNPSVAAYLLTVDDSTTTAHRGHVLIKKISAPQNFALYDITGALTDNTTWVQLALTHVASAGSFSAADPISVQFLRTGDTGAGAGDMIGANNLVVGAGGIASAATSRTNLGLGTAAVENVGAFAQVANNLSDVTAATARTNLGVAYGKQSIWVPAGAMTPRTTNGAAAGVVEMSSNKNMVSTLDFDPTTQQFAQFDARMPKSWDEGTVTFIPVWSHAATTTNFGVVWGLDAVAISDDDTMDVAFGTAQTSTDTGGTTNDSYQGPESSAITIAGTPAVGDLVQYRIHRDPANGSDTMAINARLHGVLLLYTNSASNDT